MPLTTTDAQKISDNVVSDVNANVAAPAPRTRQLSPEAALLLNKSIVARPLMVPEVCSIRVKNLEYRYRWVNKQAQNGAMYTQRRAQGFTNATTDDVEVMGGDAAISRGEITAGDLILMKISAELYDAAIKWNIEKALVLSRARGMYLNGASSDVMSDEKASRVSVSQEPFSKSGKAAPFIPDNPDAIVDDSITSGRVEKARKQNSDLREHAQSKL